MGSSKNPGPDGGSFRNSARLLNGFGIDAKERLVRAGQVHGASVRWIHQLPPKEETTGPDGSAAKVRRVADVDGLVTYNPEIVLGVVASDCYPIFFYYPPTSSMAPHGIIGMAHAGRAGVMLKIANVAVEAMYLAGAQKLSEIRVAIGPGICGKCHILHHKRDKADITFFELGYPKCISPAKSGPEMVGVDLLYVIRRQLIQAGIHAEHIEVSGECTACPENREKFFSYRRDKREAGNVQNMLSIIGFRGRDRSGSEEPSGSMR
ncbi:MAG: hypothetical protein A3H71_03570 [Candidatus Sungbacteria bacterium RIFCSPLOWO2_02_FULL_48_13b]|uniref:Purine nucleoside phosphorylase n=2 Tax=Candidatus Sungiibacteriota TaxID=1817917 RepID=A0A1G2LGD9_9BACT|nr:MAG: hypothetical protein A3C12_00475 [Candidatus Sungbacteria bacterium RIFCSPHIGHO2_02_FULL_49_20]OHA10696.1 MAG: hypothetical protein A3H71_03570 [Candidatus Sungbacteria bacterium RIFCSPLOWO2_02_FULL_48_13b]